MKSKYSKVLQTTLYQQNYVVFQKGGVRPLKLPLGAPLYMHTQLQIFQKQSKRWKKCTLFIQQSGNRTAKVN